MKSATIILQPQNAIKVQIKTTHTALVFISRRRYLQILWDDQHPDHHRIVMETIDTATYFYIRH